MSKETAMSYKAILSTKIAAVALGLLFIFFLNVRYQQYKAQRAVEQQKQVLLDQISRQEGKNKELADSLTLLSSADYKETAARQQFNLKKDGEMVFNFTNTSQSTRQDTAPQETQATQVSNNPQKWWNYFFNN